MFSTEKVIVVAADDDLMAGVLLQLKWGEVATSIRTGISQLLSQDSLQIFFYHSWLQIEHYFFSSLFRAPAIEFVRKSLKFGVRKMRIWFLHYFFNERTNKLKDKLLLQTDIFVKLLHYVTHLFWNIPSLCYAMHITGPIAMGCAHHYTAPKYLLYI